MDSQKKLSNGFILCGEKYVTDDETFRILQLVMPRAEASGDWSAAHAVMTYGQATGCIKHYDK